MIRTMYKLTGLIVLSFIGVIIITRGEQSVSPLEAGEDLSLKATAVKKIVTKWGYEVTPLLNGALPEDEWPDIDNPTDINDAFERPSKVWKAVGGYFGAFDAGEFGGGLFFATQKTIKWRRVIDAHIQHMAYFYIEKEVALFSGGTINNLGNNGNLFLVTRKANGRWIVRTVFSSETGVPIIVGRTTTHGTKKELIVFTLEDLLANPRRQMGDFFGIDCDGVVYSLGSRRD